MATRSASAPDAEPPFSQLRLLLPDEVQERYEVARPLLLQQPVSVAERNRQTVMKVGEIDSPHVSTMSLADVVQSVHMFLSNERKTYTAAAIEGNTKWQMKALIRLLGQPQHKGHKHYGEGPEDAGWSAVWQLSHGRSLRFAETVALLDSAVRPSLQLTLSYSQVYKA